MSISSKNSKLAKSILSKNEKPTFRETFTHELFEKNGREINTAILWDLYHTYLPAQSQLNSFFEFIKRHVSEADPSHFQKIAELRPTAGEYAIFSAALNDYVRNAIERRILEEAGSKHIEYRRFQQSIPFDISPSDGRIAQYQNQQIIKVNCTNEIFYAPFNKQELINKLSYAYKINFNEKVQSVAIHDAMKGKLYVHNRKRDYEYYEVFAERLQPRKQFRHTGVNSIFVDPDTKRISFDEKQVDVGLAIRAMELLNASQHSYIALVVSDTDFLPLFRHLSKNNQQYFLVHVQPVHDPNPEKWTRGVAKGYKYDAVFDPKRIINIPMSDLAYDVFLRITRNLLDRSVLGSAEFETELEANRQIYDYFERLERDEYDRAVIAEQEAYRAQLDAHFDRTFKDDQ